ncbi:MAG: NAD(P)/FAD-dependent oxidoreductase [Vulcanimicrobiaceae bacterium]
MVVGAGVAGLASAALLASKGYQVTLLEKGATPGGRAAQATWDGFTFDLGPTLLFMCDVYRELFAALGEDFDREVPTIRLSPNYRLNYPDGRTLTISPVLSETISSLERFSPGSSAGFLAYLAQAARAYELSRRDFVGKRVRSFSQFLSPRNVVSLVKAGAFRKLAASAGRAFLSEEIAGAFSFQSMYLGMSPYDSPELYCLLLFTELGEGIHFPLGGIGALPRALDRVATRAGAKLVYNSEVTALARNGSNVTAVRTDDATYEADIVVLTADLPYVYERLLEEPRHRSIRMRYTPSALLLYVALEERYPDLLHHEFLMPADLRSTCSDIFEQGVFPRDPAIYLAAPTVNDASMAPPGKEALYILVPAPNLDAQFDWSARTPELIESVLDRVEARRLPGLRSRIRFLRSRTPVDFASTLNLQRGAAFGLSHDLLQIGPMRPDTRHRRYRNCFFAGASTRPATGLPLVTMSAQQTVERICEEIPA